MRIRVTDASNNNVIQNCPFINGFYDGISVENSCYNNIRNITLTDNDYGNAYDVGDNIWNTTNTSGPNIIGGLYLGGNYWQVYTGSDGNGDGFGDTAYNVTGGTNND